MLLSVARVMSMDASAVAGLLDLAHSRPVHLLHHVQVLLPKAGDLEFPSQEIHAGHHFGMANWILFPRPVLCSRDAIWDRLPSLESRRQFLRTRPVVVGSHGWEAAPLSLHVVTVHVRQRADGAVNRGRGPLLWGFFCLVF